MRKAGEKDDLQPRCCSLGDSQGHGGRGSMLKGKEFGWRHGVIRKYTVSGLDQSIRHQRY